MANYSTLCISDLFIEIMTVYELIHHPDVTPRLHELANYFYEEEEGEGGITLLCEFCASRYEEGIETLLKAGADPNKNSTNYGVNITPFEWLLENFRFDDKSLRIALLLTEYGADLYRKGVNVNQLIDRVDERYRMEIEGEMIKEPDVE